MLVWVSQDRNPSPVTRTPPMVPKDRENGVCSLCISLLSLLLCPPPHRTQDGIGPGYPVQTTRSQGNRSQGWFGRGRADLCPKFLFLPVHPVLGEARGTQAEATWHYFPRRSGNESSGSTWKLCVHDVTMLCDAGNGSKDRTPGRPLAWDSESENVSFSVVSHPLRPHGL